MSYIYWFSYWNEINTYTVPIGKKWKYINNGSTTLMQKELKSKTPPYTTRSQFNPYQDSTHRPPIINNTKPILKIRGRNRSWWTIRGEEGQTWTKDEEYLLFSAYIYIYNSNRSKLRWGFWVWSSSNYKEEGSRIAKKFSLLIKKKKRKEK